MPEAMMLLAALICSVAGMGWLALGLDTHWRQVNAHTPRHPSSAWLRGMATVALAVAFALCMAVDHASMAVLVWVMTLTGAAIAIALLLTWRPAWLRLLVPWIRHDSSLPAP